MKKINLLLTIVLLTLAITNSANASLVYRTSPQKTELSSLTKSKHKTYFSTMEKLSVGTTFKNQARVIKSDKATGIVEIMKPDGQILKLSILDTIEGSGSDPEAIIACVVMCLFPNPFSTVMCVATLVVLSAQPAH